MKKFYSLTIIFILASISSFVPAQGAQNIIKVTDVAHQTFTGEFRDDQLAFALLPEGRLGQLLEKLPSAPRTWVIDGALLDEVFSMAQGYTIQSREDVTGVETAKIWLAKLNRMTLGDEVIALPYGNPDVALTQRAAPSELRSYYRYGQERVSFHLSREVVSNPAFILKQGKAKVSGQMRKMYTENRQALTRLSTVVDSEQLRAVRARLAILYSPMLSYKDREFFFNSAALGVDSTLQKLRITSGKYRLTSESVKLPITLINSFDVPVSVKLQLTPLNSRVQISDVKRVTLEPNSKAQLTIPLTVIASGTTSVIAQFTNKDGVVVSNDALLSLNLSVFDSQVAWFTSGAGILLLLAAATQTIRRIRRSRK